MSWLTIRTLPVLLAAFRSEGGPASAAAFGMSAPKVRQIHSLGRQRLSRNWKREKRFWGRHRTTGERMGTGRVGVSYAAFARDLGRG